MCYGVWRRWERAWFGTMRSQVRSLSPRPNRKKLRKWLNGRAPPCQGGCCGFESRLPLHNVRVSYIGNTPAFQAGKVGSIPTTRSKEKQLE